MANLLILTLWTLYATRAAIEIDIRCTVHSAPLHWQTKYHVAALNATATWNIIMEDLVETGVLVKVALAEAPPSWAGSVPITVEMKDAASPAAVSASPDAAGVQTATAGTPYQLSPRSRKVMSKE